MLDSAIHQIKIYLVDNAIGFPNTNQLDSDLSSGQHYPTFEQLKPALLMLLFVLLSFLLSFLEENILYFNYERHCCVFDDVSV